MAPSIHLLATFGGGWKSSFNNLEHWQFGIRFRCSNTAAVASDVIPTDFVPTSVNINRTESLWSIQGNWQLSGPGGDTLHVDDWLNDQLAPAATTLMGSGGLSSDMQLDYIKVYPIRSPDGRSEPAVPYPSGSPVSLFWTSSIPQGSNSGTLPLQNALVASLRSGTPGRRGRGRFYMPGLTSGTLDTTTGALSSAYTAAWATHFQTFLNSCQVSLTVPDSLHVNPIITGKPYTNYQLVTTVVVNNVIDTQRRRRKSLKGSTSSAPITII